MKQKIFLFMLLLLPGTILAQALNHSIAKPQIPQDYEQDIVRNWNGRFVVTHHITDNGWYISCSDYSGHYLHGAGYYAPTRYSDLFPSNYSISDMEILDDKLFFCGSKKKSSNPAVIVGIVGWLDLIQFMSGTFTANVIEVSSSFALNKMVVYRNAGGYKVVAVGFNDINAVAPYPLADNSMIVEIDDVTVAPTCNYSIIDRSLTNHEYIYDVIYTGNNVVFVGIVKQHINPQYHIRVMDNPSNLAASTNGNMIYAFQGDSAEVSWQPHSILMDDDIIAISYVHHDNVYDNYVTRLRIVDTHTNPPANINSQTYVIDYKEEPIDLAYSKNDETLILLQSITNIYNYNPKFAFLKPYYTWGYNADLTHFNNNITYNSLDIYNDNYFISVGKKDRTYIQQIASPSNEPNCVELGTLKVSTLKNNPTVTILDPLTWLPISIIRPQNTLNTYNWVWGYTCGR